MISRRWLNVAAIGTLLGALVLGLVVPPEETQGDLARIMFVHVPAAWLAYLAFGVTLLGSALYLITKKIEWDRRAAASAEVGVFFTGLTLALGMIWGKPTWGVWWTWDARLVLTAVMFFVYLGYLALRRGLDDPELRARRSAWLGILGVIQVPVVHFSVLWWRTLHQPPTLLRPGEMQMDAPFFSALMASLFAYTVVYAALMKLNIERQILETELGDAMASEEIEVAGAAIQAPDYGDIGETTPQRETEPRPQPPKRASGLVLAVVAAVVLVGLIITLVSVASTGDGDLSNWGWVAFAFGITYASMLAYAAWSAQRLRAVRRRLEEWR